jgi:hypothetical protein
MKTPFKGVLLAAAVFVSTLAIVPSAEAQIIVIDNQSTASGTEVTVDRGDVLLVDLLEGFSTPPKWMVASLQKFWDGRIVGENSFSTPGDLNSRGIPIWMNRWRRFTLTTLNDQCSPHTQREPIVFTLMAQNERGPIPISHFVLNVVIKHKPNCPCFQAKI